MCFVNTLSNACLLSQSSTTTDSGDFLINLDLFLDAHEGPLDLQTPQKLISASLVAPNRVLVKQSKITNPTPGTF